MKKLTSKGIRGPCAKCVVAVVALAVFCFNGGWLGLVSPGLHSPGQHEGLGIGTNRAGQTSEPETGTPIPTEALKWLGDLAQARTDLQAVVVPEGLPTQAAPDGGWWVQDRYLIYPWQPGQAADVIGIDVPIYQIGNSTIILTPSVLVTLGAHAGSSAIEALVTKFAAIGQRRLAPDCTVYSLAFEPERIPEIFDILDRLKREAPVAHAEPNWLMSGLACTADPHLDKQWAWGQSGTWPHEDEDVEVSPGAGVNVFAAWESRRSTGGRGSCRLE
jgi:hypothetical protein